MKPAAFDALDRTPAGLPIVKLMSDPDMGIDGSYGYLSLVTRGANGAKIKVAKLAELEGDMSVRELANKAVIGTTGTTNGHSHPIAPGKIETADGHTHSWDGKAATTGIANGHQHTIPESARKAEHPTDTGPFEFEISADSGMSTPNWYSLLFGPLLGLADMVTKAGDKVGPTTFNVAMMIPKLHEMLWDAQDALHFAIANIVKDEEIKDKGPAIDLALSQFSKHVSAAFGSVPAIKAEEAAQVSKLWSDGMVISGKHVINPTHTGMITAARKAMREALDTLDHLDDSKPDPVPAIKLDHLGDPDMDLTTITALADAAGTSAMKAAKTAHPQITPEQLAQVGATASAQVFKVAVAGPAQPGIPNTVLQQQLTESMGMSGNAKDPLNAMMSAINKIGGLVTKVDQIHGELFGAVDAEGKKVEGAVGLKDVVAKQGEALNSMGGIVRKIANIPEPSAAVAAQPVAGGVVVNPDTPAAPVTPAAPAATKEPVQKADADGFKNTAFDFGSGMSDVGGDAALDNANSQRR